MNDDARREAEIRGLLEECAAAAHDEWMHEKQRRGVTTWPNERGFEQLVPYADLAEDVRDFDRIVVGAIMRVLEAKGPVRSAPRAEITEEEVDQARNAYMNSASEGGDMYDALRAALSASHAYRDAEIARLRRIESRVAKYVDAMTHGEEAAVCGGLLAELRNALAAEPQQPTGEAG